MRRKMSYYEYIGRNKEYQRKWNYLVDVLCLLRELDIVRENWVVHVPVMNYIDKYGLK